MLFNYYFFFILVNIIFVIGILGLFMSKYSNFFYILSIEILFLAINLNFFFTSIFIQNLDGIIFLFFVVLVSGGEISIFLSIFIVYYKRVFLQDIYEQFKNIKY